MDEPSIDGFVLDAFGVICFITNLMGRMETQNYQKENCNLKRKFVEIEKEVSKNLELFCFLKDIPRKQFVSNTIKKELRPYETWLERAKKLKFSYS
jgi:hypothetical protein